MAAQNGGGLGDVVIHAAGAAGYDALIHHEPAVYQLIGQVQAGLAAELCIGALFHLAQMVARIVDKLTERHGLGRVERQQKFMKALAKQAFTVGNMVKLPMIIGTASEYVKTDMTFIQMVKAANCLRLFGEGGVKSASLKGDFGDIGGVSYWVTTPSKIAATLDELKIPHRRIPSI